MRKSRQKEPLKDGCDAKILVVDDDERNLLALAEVLKPIAEVVTATSGNDALRLLMIKDFAVILLDVFMPGIDGYETAGLIREREQTAGIPIIFLSAVNKETEHLMRGYEMGAVDYVFKPVDPIVLKSKVSVFVDLYRVRRKLEDSERRQASILQSLPMAIYEASREDGGKIRRRFVGGDLGHFFGKRAGDIQSGEAVWEDWIHPDDSDRVTSLPTGESESSTVEYRWIGPDGMTRYLLEQRVGIAGVKSSSRWAGTLLDISDRKQLEAQLVQVGKLDALGQMTGGVAHDFNNLLAAVLGGVHILERRLLLGEREQKVIDHMRHAAEQGTELVRRLMTFTRQQDLMPVSISSDTLCESVAGVVNHSLGGTVVVDWKCADAKVNLFVDRNQLELALMNLIINARDAMPNGGTIKVSIDACADSEIGRPALRIRVADEGNGIPQNIVGKVTEPFFTTKGTGKGTGLGLSMVAGFVHQSGGKLEIASTPGKGTAIDLILPSTEAAPHADKRIEGLGATWFSNKRLLLIDDDDAVRLVMSEQFRDAGGIVDDYATGHGAIDAVKKSPSTYDFVLSDFAMPGINGLETLKQIAKLAPTARLALMTGFAEEALLCKDQKIPVVRKPVDMRKVATIFAS